MIACILAGGEGTRLRPLSCRRPKPLTPLVTRSVMGHMLAHLSACGIRRACVTLRHMPGLIRDAFGDGQDWGVSLSYYEETQALGTAGGAANCDFPEDEEILIVSGDGVCDFDFQKALAFHREKGAYATILVSHAALPLEYGVVLTDGDGRVTGFSEKPAWQSVKSDTVNTGIYILSPEVMRHIVKGKASDFSRDVFPEMLRRHEPLYAFAPEGYWCDIGDCGAYLSCVHDALAGKIGISLPKSADGVCALSEIPEGVQICAPVYIGRGVKLGKDARIGPFTVLGDGASIGRGTVAEGCVIYGSTGENAFLTDAIVGFGASVGDGAVLERGTVLGDGARVGAHTTVRAGVRIWPDCDTGEDTVVRFPMQREGSTRRLRFSPGAVLEGAPELLTPEVGASLGGALAAVSGGKIGLASTSDPAAQAFAAAVEAGIRAGGADAARMEDGFGALAAFALPRVGCALSAHVGAEDGELRVRIFSSDGLPADEGVCRKLENLLASGDFPRADAESAGALWKISGVREKYMRACLSFGMAPRLRFRAEGGESADLLADSLFLMGAEQAQGGLLFAPSADGFALSALDEDGKPLDDAHTLACAFYALAAESAQDVLACPEDAPQALDAIAAQFGKRAVRPSESAQARDALAKLPALTDGILRACFLAAYLSRRGLTLSELSGEIPVFASFDAHIPLHAGRARFMRAAQEAGLRADGVRFAPDAGREALRVFAESRTAEAAKALCEGFCEQAKRLDTDLKRQKRRLP